MSIKRISSNKYKICIELGYDALGNRKRMYRTINGSKEDAIKYETKLKKEYYHIGNSLQLYDITFEQYSELYIKKYCEHNIEPVTLHEYIRLLKNINLIIGKKKLRDLSSLVLDDLYSKLWYGKNGKELTYHSKYGYYKLIRSMLNRAVDWQLISSNPNDKVSLKPKKEYKKKKIYDIEDVKKLLKVLENEPIKWRTLIVLTLDTGARRGEICALRLNDIDLDKRTIRINKSLKIVDKIVYEDKTKTPSSIREVIITETTVEMLRKYLAWQDDYKKKIGDKWREEGRLFTSRDGGPICLTDCDHIVKKIVKKYNLPPLTFHQLRHVSASILLNSGVDPKTISNRLGWATNNMLYQVYGHSFDSSKLECVNKLNEILK